MYLPTARRFRVRLPASLGIVARSGATPMPRVRHALPLVMDNLRRTGGYPPMTGAQLRMLQARADTMFDQSRGLLVPNELTMEMVWKTVLR